MAIQKVDYERNPINLFNLVFTLRKTYKANTSFDEFSHFCFLSMIWPSATIHIRIYMSVYK